MDGRCTQVSISGRGDVKMMRSKIIGMLALGRSWTDGVVASSTDNESYKLRGGMSVTASSARAHAFGMDACRHTAPVIHRQGIYICGRYG